MNRNLPYIILLVFLLSVHTTFAQDNAMKYFIGKWNLELTFAANKTSTPDIQAIWIVENGLDSTFCLLGHVIVNKKVFTREIMAYDPSIKEYTRTITANDGSYYVFSTKGWKGDRLLWTCTQYTALGPIKMQEDITKVSANEFHAVYYRMQDRYWKETQREILRRTGH